MKLAAEYLVIGGGVAGTTASETIRAKNPSASVMLVSEEREPLYSRVLLPQYVRGERRREDMYLKTAFWYAERNIKWFGGNKVVALDTSIKEATLDNGSVITFGKALIACGGALRKLPIPESKNPILYLRTIQDADLLVSAIAKLKQLPEIQRKVVIVGSSFIALEIATSFAAHRISGTIVIRGPYFWHNRLANSSAAAIEQALEEHGFSIARDAELVGTGPDTAVLQGGSTVPARIIAAGVGINPEPSFWKDHKEGIVTDEFLGTKYKDIFAAGDCAKALHPVIGRPIRIGNWTNSTVQGRLAGANMGGERKALSLISAYSASYFGIDVSFIGDCEHTDGTELRKIPGGQIFIRENRIVGAALVAAPQLRNPLTQAIQQKQSFDLVKKLIT